MNPEQLKGKLEELKNMAQKTWEKFKADDLPRIDEKRKELTAKLVEYSGVVRKEIENRIEQYKKDKQNNNQQNDK